MQYLKWEIAQKTKNTNHNGRINLVRHYLVSTKITNQKAMHPKVSLITVNFNQPEITRQLLLSVRQCGLFDKGCEVLVIDNGSQQSIEKLLGAAFPEVTFIRSEKNLGFAGGNNLGIEAAKGEYLFFVNNDTEIMPDTVEKLLAVFAQKADAGIVCPKICYFEPPNLIQYVGYSAINPYTGRNRTLGQFEPDKGQYRQIMPTHYAHGAAMMIRHEVIDQVGMMPEMFFLYYEELDWSEQIKQAGYTIYVEPNAVVYHKESVSVGTLNPLKTYYLTRNRILFMRRNAKMSEKIGFFVFLILFTIPKNTLLFLFKRQYKHLIAFWKGILWHLTYTPNFIRHRRTTTKTDFWPQIAK